MFLDFFLDLKKVKIPVSLNEYFNFLEALKQGLSLFDLNSFYYLARSSLIKDEKLIDRFDLVFSKCFSHKVHLLIASRTTSTFKSSFSGKE